MNAGRLRMATRLIVLLAAGLSYQAVARGDVIYEPEVIYQTDDPFGGVFGIEGWDVAAVQSVAVRFIPESDYTLGMLRLWLWSDDLSGGHPRLRITLCDDSVTAGESRPGKVLFEQWEIEMPFTGLFNPQLFDFDSAVHPHLRAGQRYWVVASSDAPLPGCPVWACGQPHPAFLSLREPPGSWYAGMSGEAGAMIVLGTRVPAPAATVSGAIGD